LKPGGRRISAATLWIDWDVQLLGELPHGAALGLRPRRRAAVGVRARVGRGAVAAPIGAVVAVEVGAQAALARLRLVARAVLALQRLDATGRERHLAARDDVAVGVDDREDEHAHASEQRGDARVAAVAAREVEGEFHAHLGRRPFARVVQAHYDVHGAPVVAAVDVTGDLHARQRAALDRLARELDTAHDARVRLRELVERGRVVRRHAVAVAAAGDRGAAQAVEHAVVAQGASQVGVVVRDDLAHGERLRQPGPLGVRVDDDAGGGRGEVLLVVDVEPEPLELRDVGAAGDRHLDDRGPRRRRGRDQEEAQPDGREQQINAASLHVLTILPASGLAGRARGA